MSVNIDLISRGIVIFHGKITSYRRAGILLNTLGSREEFVAWLILRDDFIQMNPKISETLAKLSEGGFARLTACNGTVAFIPSSQTDEFDNLEHAIVQLVRSADQFTALAENVNDMRQRLNTT